MKETAQPEPAQPATPQSMAELRWKGTTAKERSEFASRIAKLGWTAKNRKRRTKAGGRPKMDAPRCPCGLMTVKCAKARCHKCEAAQ